MHGNASQNCPICHEQTGASRFGPARRYCSAACRKAMELRRRTWDRTMARAAAHDRKAAVYAGGSPLERGWSVLNREQARWERARITPERP